MSTTELTSPASFASPLASSSATSAPFAADRAPIESLYEGDWPPWRVLQLRYIHHIIAACGYNKTKAAVALGIDRRTLNRILARERAAKERALRRAQLAQVNQVNQVNQSKAPKRQAPRAGTAILTARS